MSGRTGIEWTDRTWNPVVGCTKVSQGCKLCYAKTIHDMRHAAHQAGKKVAPQYAHPFEHVQLKPERLGWPLSLREPSKIFVNSVSDLFHEDVPDEFIDQVFAVMAQADRHVFQVLTKRPARMLQWVDGASNRINAAMNFPDWLPVGRAVRRFLSQWPLPNVWLGVSAENQDAADERIPLLLQTPAAIRFLSCEPLLGPLDLSIYLEGEGYIGDQYVRPIDWVIVGGESGSSKQGPRPMHPEWVRSLRDQCVADGVPFLFKQWGEYVNIDSPGSHLAKVGKKRAGRELDGRTWDEYPVAS